MARTDIHRPAEINPLEYDFVGLSYVGQYEEVNEAGFVARHRSQISDHMENTGGRFSDHEHGGNCHVCGAHCHYTAIFYHRPTNVYIETGLDCAENMRMGDPAIYRKFRAEVQGLLHQRKGKQNAEETLAIAGMGFAWEVYQHAGNDQEWLIQHGCMEERCPNTRTWNADTLVSIVGSLIKYGKFVSEAQENLLRKCMKRIQAEPERRRKRKEEQERQATLTSDCPEGKQVIEGTVLSVKYKESFGYSVLKVLVKDKRGYKVWGTLPKAIEDADKGEVITFTANVKPSDDDPKFGFFKQPSKARFLERHKDNIDIDAPTNDDMSYEQPNPHDIAT